MSDLEHPSVQESTLAQLRSLRERVPSLALLRKDVASSGPSWLPLVLVLGALAAVAYADHRVVSVSLVYLYILPVGLGAIFLRKVISYSLIAACVLFHDYYSPRYIAVYRCGDTHLSQSFRQVVLRLCCLCHPAVYGTEGIAGQNRAAAA